ncbi:hypothetical protein BDN70DRAFT_923250 [Pholiota conissans]|uniref:Structure-specific endonuclease subunit SLX4 n=1 Tax=Pholiota conissans TaxID=109636 RepID=A0A9P5YYT0_9AGAR|nr:hypothetical protein BDN70DRAFT_923250 [Pholiota conissans]
MPGVPAHPQVYNFSCDEIVDDSEPERAELRKQGRRARAKQSLKSSDTKTGTLPDGVCHGAVASAEASTSTLNSPLLPNISGQISPKTLDLRQFAFKNPPVRKKPIASARGITTATLATLSTDVERPTPQIVKSLDIASADLAKITRCVSCDLLWTARKTAIQKMSHIKSCAKKNNFSDETIQLLIRKEITNRVPVEKPNRGKGKDSIMNASSKAKDTYMDVIIDVARPRKKGKRKQTHNLLAKASSNRDSILERAKVILASENNHDIKLTAYSTSKHAPKPAENTDVDATLLATQTFGRSALAQQLGGSPTNFFAIYSSQNIDNSKDVSLARISPNHIPSSTLDVIPRAIPRTEHRCDSMQSVGGPSDVPISELFSICHLSPPIVEKSVHDHVRVCVPHRDILISCFLGRQGVAPSMNPPLPLTATKKVRKSKMKPPHTPSEHHEGKSGSDLYSTPTKRPRTRKKSTKNAGVVRSFDQRWESHMTDSIRQDTNLYLRILRYEPIDFNVFLEISQQYHPNGGRLKLRAYLDQNAIHFYGASRV